MEGNSESRATGFGNGRAGSPSLSALSTNEWTTGDSVPRARVVTVRNGGGIHEGIAVVEGGIPLKQ